MQKKLIDTFQEVYISNFFVFVYSFLEPVKTRPAEPKGKWTLLPFIS